MFSITLGQVYKKHNIFLIFIMYVLCYVCVLVEARRQPLVSSSGTPPTSLRQGLSLAGSSPIGYTVCPASPRVLLSLPPQRWEQKCAATPEFVSGLLGSNSGPHTCKTSTLLNGLSRQFLFFLS